MRRLDASIGSLVLGICFALAAPKAMPADVIVFADIFISADLDWMDYVEQRKMIVPGTRVNLLRNTLGFGLAQ